MALSLGFAIDIALCYVVARIVSENGSDAVSLTLIFLAVFWGARIANSVKQAIVNVIVHYTTKWKRVAKLVDEFKQFGLPTEDRVYNDASEYFTAAATNERLSADARLYAGATMGQIDVMKLYSPFDAIRSSILLEQALDKYLRRGKG